MRGKITLGLALVALAALLLGVAVASAQGGAGSQGGLTPQERLGKSLFFDPNLSVNSNQSCAVCHSNATGYTGPKELINQHGGVYEGSIPGAFGNRKPPTSAYCGDSPILHYDQAEEVWIGGMFWDGRSAGDVLGDPLAEQAQGPFLNAMEQALPDASAVVSRVRASSYKDLFASQCPGSNITDLYNCIGHAIAAYERSYEVGPFTSKFDYWLKGQATLSTEEQLGLELFNGKAQCSACHTSEGQQPLFTDFSYDNLGIPKNLENPATMADPTYADPGLGGYLKEAGKAEAVWQPEVGKFKVPTLRNVDRRPSSTFVKAYGHNGFFKSLEDIVHYYNTRDVAGAGWPAPEVSDNLNDTELGDLGLTAEEEQALVAFMKTLTDGYGQNINLYLPFSYR